MVPNKHPTTQHQQAHLLPLTPAQRRELRRVFMGQYKAGARGEVCPVRRVPLYNCWGLVMAVTRIMDMPAPEITAPAMPTARAVNTLHKRMQQYFVQVATPTRGCLIALRTHPRLVRAVNHFGVVLDDASFVHIQRSVGVHVSRFDIPPYQGMVAGFWLPQSIKGVCEVCDG